MLVWHITDKPTKEIKKIKWVCIFVYMLFHRPESQWNNQMLRSHLYLTWDKFASSPTCIILRMQFQLFASGLCGSCLLILLGFWRGGKVSILHHSVAASGIHSRTLVTCCWKDILIKAFHFLHSSGICYEPTVCK